MASREKRIEEMERCLDASREAFNRLNEALNGYESVLRDYQKLCRYYGSAQWMKDFEADEAGRLPAELKRGVLSEDAVYDLITDHHALAVRTLKMLAGVLEKQAL